MEGVVIHVPTGVDGAILALMLRAQEPAMIGPSGTVCILVVPKPVGFRKGAGGLAALVRDTVVADRFSGAVYVFRDERADRTKLVF